MRRFRESQLSQDGVASRLNHRKRRRNRNIHLRSHKRKARCRNKTNDKENVSPSSLSHQTPTHSALLYSTLLNWSINVPAITAINNKGGIKNVLVSKVIRGKNL